MMRAEYIGGLGPVLIVTPAEFLTMSECTEKIEIAEYAGEVEEEDGKPLEVITIYSRFIAADRYGPAATIICGELAKWFSMKDGRHLPVFLGEEEAGE